jgi:uncharacterized membrane protein
MRSMQLARGLFSIAAVSLALLALVYGDLAPGGVALPAWLPARAALVSVIAVLVLAAGIGIWFPRTAPASALTVCGYEVLWAACGAPVILTQPLSIGVWYPLCEGLSALVGSWIVYALLRRAPPGGAGATSPHGAVRTAQIVFGLTCIFFGASHFAYASYTASMVPSWLPGPLALAYLTGVGHVAGGLSIVLGVLALPGATLEAIMMSLFGLLVWLPTFLEQHPPEWATPAHNRWSELVVNIALAASAWIVAASFRGPSSPRFRVAS